MPALGSREEFKPTRGFFAFAIWAGVSLAGITFGLMYLWVMLVTGNIDPG